MPVDDVFDFELAEWYLSRNGDLWGPVDLDGLRSLVTAGRANGSSLVRRDGESAWVRLDSLVPDAVDDALRAFREAEAREPALHVFRCRRWVVALEGAAWPALGYVLGAALFQSVDMFGLSAVLVGGAIGGFMGAGFQRVEVTANSVRAQVGFGRTLTMPIDAIDRARIGDESLYARLSGMRTIRSRDGSKIWVNRRALGEVEFGRLMGTLQIDAR